MDLYKLSNNAFVNSLINFKLYLCALYDSMKMPRHCLIILFFFLSLSPFLQASEEKVFSATENKSYVFRYHSEEGNSVSNYILKELARYYIINLNKASYTILFNEEITLYRRDDDVLRLSVRIENVRFEGFSRFEGFLLDDILLPDLADFNINFTSGNNMAESIKFSAIPVKNSPSEVLSIEIGKKEQLPSGISCDWKKLYYKPETRNLYDDKIQRIYNYLAAKYILENTLIRAEAVDFSSKEQLPFTWLQISEIRKAYNSLQSGNFGTGFLLYSADSVTYHENLRKLLTHTIRLKTLFYLEVDSITPGLVSIDAHKIADSLIVTQLNYLDLTNTVSHYYAPMITQLASIAQNKNAFGEFLEGLGMLAGKAGYPGGNIEFQTNFIDNCYHLNIKKADEYIISENFTYSIELLENAQELCTTYHIDCSDNLFQTISRAKYGIYYSYLSIAGQAFEVNKLQMAERYLKMAGEFQKANQDFIISDVSVQRYYNRLLIKLVEEAKNLLLVNKPDQALENLTRAEEYCENQSPEECGEYVSVVRKQAKRAIYRNYISKAETLFKSGKTNEAADVLYEAGAFQVASFSEVPVTREYRSLLISIKQKEYEQMLANAREALKENDVEGSGVFTRKALEIQSSFGFEKDSILEAMVPASKKAEIKQKIDTANGLLWDHQLVQASKKINEIRDEITALSIDTDMELIRQLRRLDSLYLVISCKTADESFGISTLEAERNYRTGNLAKGYDFFRQASETQSASPKCSFDLQLLLKIEQKYQNYFVCRSFYDSAIFARSHKNYVQAIRVFDQAWKVASCDTIKNAVFGNSDYTTFVHDAGDPEFYNAATTFFIENGNVAEAFSLVKHGFHQGIVIPSYKAVLETAGRYYAEQDFAASATGTHQPNPQKYTGKDTWLKEFTRMYLTRWNELEIEGKK